MFDDDYGYEMEAIEDERRDADRLQAQYVAESNAFWRDQQRVNALRKSGSLEEAAALCHHSGGYPLKSLAAEHSNDPAQGEDGYRCVDCGSRLAESPFDNRDAEVTHPCEITPEGHGAKADEVLGEEK